LTDIKAVTLETEYCKPCEYANKSWANPRVYKYHLKPWNLTSQCYFT